MNAALGMKPGARFVAIHPFGSTRRQWWPSGRVNELASALVRDRDTNVVLVGGPETRGLVSLEAERSFDATGVLTISELVALLADASLVVSTDSGPFHIAGALGTPLVGLFRSSRPEHATR